MTYKKMLIKLPSGREIQVRGYISANDMTDILSTSKERSARQRFIDLIMNLKLDDEFTEDEISDIPDEQLEEIGRKLMVGEDLKEEFEKSSESDFFAKFFDAHESHWTKTTKRLQESIKKSTQPLLSSVKQIQNSLKPFRSSLNQAAKLNKMIEQIPQIKSGESLNNWQQTLSKIDPEALVPADVKLLRKLIDEEREHASANIEVQKQIAETLQKLVDDSAKAQKSSNRQQWINIGIAFLTLIVAAITLIIAA